MMLIHCENIDIMSCFNFNDIHHVCTPSKNSQYVVVVIHMQIASIMNWIYHCENWENSIVHSVTCSSYIFIFPFYIWMVSYKGTITLARMPLRFLTQFYFYFKCFDKVLWVDKNLLLTRVIPPRVLLHYNIIYSINFEHLLS